MTQSNLLSNYTYMKTGGPADEIIEVTDQPTLIQLVKDCRAKSRRFFILGGGSNTLFTDAGFRGLVIINRIKQLEIDKQTGQVVAASGCPVNFLVNQTAAQGLSGLEWYLGLPGTVGGAVYNNSHFKNHLIGEVITSVSVLTPDNQTVTLTAAELEFGYDYSRFHHSGEIILSASFKLTPDQPELVQARAAESLKTRSATQPLTLPSSGCIFQNPGGDRSAGALIDAAGLKNTTIGKARVSDVHANFIVNDGGATSADIYALADQVQATVAKQFGINLKREVFFINEFGERVAR